MIIPALFINLSVRLIACPTRDGGSTTSQGFFALVAIKKLPSKNIPAKTAAAMPVMN